VRKGNATSPSVSPFSPSSGKPSETLTYITAPGLWASTPDGHPTQDLIAGLLLLPGPVRRILTARVRPILAEVGPRLVTIGQRPWKIVEGVGGILLPNSTFALCMIACCEAFGAGNANYAAIALVHLAGPTIGQAAPTPGGLGAVEAAYIAGLTSAGVSAPISVSATLLFRLLTFWLPTIPGYWCFNWLQRVGNL
jgi:hypothetical protein